MPDRVLITGARAPAALAVARSFAAAGFEAHLADSSPAFMARASFAVAGVHRHASPRSAPEAFASDIQRLVGTLQPRLVVPTCEEVFHLALAGGGCGMADRLFAPSSDALRRLHSKHAFGHACAALSLPAPPTVRVTDPEALRRAAADPARIVVKREFSRFGVQALVSPGAADLSRIRPRQDEAWVVQERIAGEEVSFYAVCVGGRLTAFSAYRSTWRLAGGAGYAFRSLDGAIMEQLRAHAAVLAREIVGTGQFACDAILDADGKAWLIECNPRSTSGVFLFGRSEDLAQAMLGRAMTTDLVPACDVRPAMWSYGLAEALRTGRLSEWARHIREGSDVVGVPGDRLPAAGALVDTVVFARRALGAGQSLNAAMTADIEWNGDAS